MVMRNIKFFLDNETKTFQNRVPGLLLKLVIKVINAYNRIVQRKISLMIPPSRYNDIKN